MSTSSAGPSYETLRRQLDGELHDDMLHRRLYATDASIYRRLPAAVAIPASVEDLQRIVRFASEHRLGLIPRTAGTSLAGQCVGDGIVVDVSKHFGEILNLDVQGRRVTVQPGVVRDELNRQLHRHGLFFSPNTSTSNRSMIGGMVGNNSCGSTSIRYGCTRDKIISIDAVLSDGSLATFDPIDRDEFLRRCQSEGRRGDIYRVLRDQLSRPEVHRQIRDGYPSPEVTRRNTGYALDELIACDALGGGSGPLQMGKLLAGSEGTLALTTSVTLRLDPLPPTKNVMVVAHFTTIDECVGSASVAMRHPLHACEMIDKTILDLTANNSAQAENRQLIVGDPAGVLMCELAADEDAVLSQLAADLVRSLDDETGSYATVVLRGDEVDRVMDLRKSGLGLLGNMVGDAKSVACIEDTAVPLSSLRDYIAEFSALMNAADQTPVYYAHAGAGELHLRSVLNLKQQCGVEQLVSITDSVADLVGRYGGSMSGEHGDGIVRSKYIAKMVGLENYEIMRAVKHAADPQGIFNPGKIIDALPQTEGLRYRPGEPHEEPETVMRFSAAGGILRHAEKCNGSGDCLKSLAAGGVMCPSYRVTSAEQDSTRGRANVLREILTHSDSPNRFDDAELRGAMDLCVGCKACRRECPSSVDMAALKAEFDHQYAQTHGHSLRSRLFAHNDRGNQLARRMMPLSGAIMRHGGGLMKRLLRIAPQRSLPVLSRQTLRQWCDQHLDSAQPTKATSTVTLFIDEFTDQLESDVGVDAIELLTTLGYRVRVRDHPPSGRALISQGFLEQAKSVANQNVALFDPATDDDSPLIGIEPSTTLTLRDEYPRLADDEAAAIRVASRTKTIDEFLAAEFKRGAFGCDCFDETERRIAVHVHCHQKALSDPAATLAMLSIPRGATAEMILAGCCGMAGSFGYEAEHYEISMAMAEQGLLPAVRAADESTIIAAGGTSCRTQIVDGTGRTALHPVTVLRQCLRVPRQVVPDDFRRGAFERIMGR